jgi:hypothetical protein
MLLTAVASPFKSVVDDAIAKAFGMALLAVFFFALVIKVSVLTEAVEDFIPNKMRYNFEYDFVVVSAGMTVAVALAFIVTACVAIQQLLKAARTPVIKLRSTSTRPALTVDPDIIWHLFLSHIWSTGQDQCATIKRQLALLMPGISVFLDVDDLESIDALEDYIEGSQAIQIFASKGYFTSKNCLREVRTAIDKAKPLVLVHDPVRGGATLADIMKDECPPEMQSIFQGLKVIEWHRIKDFQLVSLKLIGSEVLMACPGYKEQYSVSYFDNQDDFERHKLTRKDSGLRGAVYDDIWVPGEITEMPLKFKDSVRLYVSPDNPGSQKVAAVLKAAIAGLEITAAPPPTATHFLLYLSHDTFVGEAGDKLAHEVRTMTRWAPGSILMVHENDMENGGCEFARFFSTTPQDIIAGGLYKALALAYYPGIFRPVSLTLIAKRLGARSKASSWRSTLNLSAAASVRRNSSVEMAQVVVKVAGRRTSTDGTPRGTPRGTKAKEKAAAERASSSASSTIQDSDPTPPPSPRRF